MTKTMRVISLFIVLALLTAGCSTFGKDEKTGAEESAAGSSGGETMTGSDQAVINAWGDSITEGYGGFGISYPSVLSELTGMTVNNFGIGGEDSLQIMERCLEYGSQENNILIMQMGDNGGWDDMDQLIAQYRKMIEESGSERYIIISSSDDPDDFEQIWGYTRDGVGPDDTWYEKKLRDAFGEHVFLSRKYLIENGLKINRLKETLEDRVRAAKGNISLQLRNPEIDNTHLNAAGYTALAYGIFEKGKELGYWEGISPGLKTKGSDMQTIYLAGGCFWGVQKYFDQFEGVLATEAGYANGPDEAPSYKEVCASSGHAETVKIEYDPAKISLTELLNYYFMVIDPQSVNKQGNDRGIQYRTGIYYTDEEQLPEIEAVYREQEEKAGAKLAVELEPLANFFTAEEYHQKYLEKNPNGYCHIPGNMFHLE